MPNPISHHFTQELGSLFQNGQTAPISKNTFDQSVSLNRLNMIRNIALGTLGIVALAATTYFSYQYLSLNSLPQQPDNTPPPTLTPTTPSPVITPTLPPLNFTPTVPPYTLTPTLPPLNLTPIAPAPIHKPTLPPFSPTRPENFTSTKGFNPLDQSLPTYNNSAVTAGLFTLATTTIGAALTCLRNPLNHIIQQQAPIRVLPVQVISANASGVPPQPEFVSMIHGHLSEEHENKVLNNWTPAHLPGQSNPRLTTLSIHRTAYKVDAVADDHLASIERRYEIQQPIEEKETQLPVRKKKRMPRQFALLDLKQKADGTIDPKNTRLILSTKNRKNILSLPITIIATRKTNELADTLIEKVHTKAAKNACFALKEYAEDDIVCQAIENVNNAIAIIKLKQSEQPTETNLSESLLQSIIYPQVPTQPSRAVLGVNFSAIAGFEYDPNRQIKSDQYGKLFIPENVGDWVYGYAMGTVLKDTIKVIQRTTDDVSTYCSSTIDISKKMINSEQDRAKVIESIEMMNGAIKTAIKFQIGLRNIYRVYNNRYENDPARQEDLQELSTMYRQFEVFVAKMQQDSTDAAGKADIAISPPTEKEVKALLKNQANAAWSLDVFCKTYNVHLSAEQVIQMIDEGNTLFNKIIDGQVTEPSNDEKTKQHELASLTWFLTARAIDKKQGFSNGALMIEDRNNRFYNYLKKAAGSDSPNRYSSHFVSRSPHNKWTGAGTSSHQYGIDVTNDELPCRKRHILFERIPMLPNTQPESLLFYKIEEHSPFITTGYGKDFIMHGVGFVKSKYNSIFSPEGHEGMGMKKEKVPVDVVGAYKALEAKLKELNIVTLDFAKMRKNIKLFGIAYAIQIGKEIREIVAKTPHHLPELDQYFAILNQPDYDHPTLRTGREVILTQSELSQERLDGKIPVVEESDYLNKSFLKSFVLIDDKDQPSLPTGSGKAEKDPSLSIDGNDEQVVDSSVLESTIFADRYNRQ